MLTRQIRTVASQRPIPPTRLFSTSPQWRNGGNTEQLTQAPAVNPRWLTMTKRRIGKVLFSKVSPQQTQEAAAILRQLARDWRGLIAGSEGFLTDWNRRGLYQHNVVWGEMVWMPDLD